MVLKKGFGFLSMTLGFLPSLHAEKATLHNLPLHLPPYYLSRPHYLQQIENHFKNNEHILAIIGMGGLGKTQLAKEYATQNYHQYNVLWWFDGNQDLLPQLRELGEKLKLHKECQFPSLRETSSTLWLRAIKVCCTGHFSSTLFILDDVKKKDQANELIQGVPEAHIILTSRDPTIERNIMVLKGFTRKESIQYLTKALPQGTPEEWNKLAESLKDYPLALSQAVSFIESYPSLTLEEYLKLYTEKKNSLWAKEEKLLQRANKDLNSSEDYHHTVATTFMLLLDQLGQNSPHALEVLKLISLLGSQNIPKRYLRDWMINQRQLTDFDFHGAISSLIRLSIFEKNEGDGGCEETYNVHALFHEFIREKLTEEEKEFYLNQTTQLIGRMLPESSQKVWRTLSKERYLEFHLESLLKFANQYDFSSDELLKLKIKYLHFVYFFNFDVRAASEKIFDLEKEVRSNNRIQPLDKAKFLTLLSNFVAFGRDCQEAISYSEEAEQLLTNTQLQEAREEMFFLLANNLMDFYSYKGNLKKAEEAAEKAAHLLPYISDSGFIALYHHIRVLQLLAKGDYSEALKHIDISIESSPATDFLPYVHFFKKAIKAETLAKLGKLEEAAALAEPSYKELKKFYPDVANYKTIRAEIALAFIYLKQGKLKDAFHLTNLIIDGLGVFYKTPYESPLQVWPHILLGELCEKQDNLSEALKEYKKAEDVCRHIYSTIEVDDMSYLYRNLALLGAKMKDEHLLKTYLDLLIEHFGFDHPKTIEAIQTLDDQNTNVL